MSAFELHIADLDQVQAAIAAGIQEGLREAVRPAGGWLNLQGVAALYGISVEALYKRPHLVPPRHGPENGAPDSQHVYRTDEAQAMVYMPEAERERLYFQRMRGKA